MTTIYTTKPLPARAEWDFYPTPESVCSAALAAAIPTDFTPARILDPGSGTGVWGNAARRRWPSAHIIGAEIRAIPQPDDYDEWIQGDFRLQDVPTVDLVMGNPPYKFAESFVRLGLQSLAPAGYLVYLLRLNFLEGKARAKGLYRHFPLLACYVVGRVSYTGDNRSNATAYGLFVWQQGYSGETALRWMKQAA